MGQEKIPSTDTAAAEELSRLLEIGWLLSAVLTSEEVANLRVLIVRRGIAETELFSLSSKLEIGNTSVT